MPRKRQPEMPSEPEVDPETGIRFLKRQIEKGRALLASRPLSDDAYKQWELLTRNYLEEAFGRNSPNISSVMDVGKYGAFPMGAGDEWWENQRAESLTTQLTRLDGLVELLQTELQLQGGRLISRPAFTSTGHRIFLVHGPRRGCAAGGCTVSRAIGPRCHRLAGTAEPWPHDHREVRRLQRRWLRRSFTDGRRSWGTSSGGIRRAAAPGPIERHS